MADRLHYVANLKFGGVDRTSAVTGIGVRAVDDEEVRKVRDGHTKVCPGIVETPLLTQCRAGLSDDVHRPEELQNLEASSQHDHVGRHFNSRAGHDVLAADLIYRFGDQRDIVAAHRLVPVVID